MGTTSNHHAPYDLGYTRTVSYTHLKDGRPVGLSFFSSEFTPEEISVIARIETVSTDISNSVRELSLIHISHGI